MLKLKSWTDSSYTTKVLFIWFSYSLFLLSSLTSFRSNRFRVKSHQFSAAYLWRVTDYRFTRGHLVIYSLSICYRNLTNFLTINRIRFSTLYRVFHIEMFLLKWLWQIEICKLDFAWRYLYIPEVWKFEFHQQVFKKGTRVGLNSLWELNF